MFSNMIDELTIINKILNYYHKQIKNAIIGMQRLNVLVMNPFAISLNCLLTI